MEAVIASPDIGRFFDLERAQPHLEGLVQRVVDEAVTQRRKRGLH